jgi:uncharacterized protein
MASKLFYTIARIGPKQSITPEGYLLCEEVPVARTGMMIYGGEELEDATGEPVIKPDENGLVRVFRTPEEVFRPETIASFNGKSVTDDHPDDHVKPETWKELTVGIMLNLRRGEGEQDDLLLADLLITTPEAIELVQKGKREVSCGYSADYEQIGVGEGTQKNIIGNHVALVESGRCGWRCAIGDRSFRSKKMAEKDPPVAKPGKKLSWMDRAKKAFFSRDEEEFNEAMSEADEAGGIHLHMPGKTDDGDFVPKAEFEAHVKKNEEEHKQFRDSLEELGKKLGEKTSQEADGGATEDEKEIEGQLEEEAPVGTGDKARKATDSAYLSDSYRDTIAAAEILSPGIRTFTFDQSAKPGLTFKRLCAFRAESLDLAYATPAGRAAIDDVLGGKALDTKKMSCDALRTTFRSASAIRKSKNNDSNRGQESLSGAGIDVVHAGIKSVSDIGKEWEKKYGQQS